ncbi:MAG: hypothetical protein L7S47_08675 [Acidimicrobiales bacterium]|nr:hypothetical protein [Acidimicrobiales bacterium]
MMFSMTSFPVNDAMIKVRGGEPQMLKTGVIRGGIVSLLLGLVVVCAGWSVYFTGKGEKGVIDIKSNQ